MPKEYADILKELKAPFPKGTVQRNRYIPHQVYVDRLETAAESQWNKEVRELEIRPDLGFVKVVVRVTILDHHREGVGFETIEKDTGGQLRTENAVDLAVARAFVSAIDDWQVGWLDLAIEANRDWANNPGITLLQPLKNKDASDTGAGNTKDKMRKGTITTRVCKICENELSAEDIAILKRIPNQNIDYCNKHLPSHRREKIRT